MKGQGFYLATGIMLALIMAFPAQLLAADIEANLPDSNSTSAFRVTNSLDNTLLKVQSGGRVGIGTTSPERQLHVVGGYLVKFESTYTGSHASLDLDSPNIAVGNYCRLDWRSNDSADNNEQFAAIDVIYTDKNSISEDADIRFVTMHNGTREEHMRIESRGYVGVGTNNPLHALDVQRDYSGGYVTNIENDSDSLNADVLRLRVDRNTPGAGNNFIGFYSGTGSAGAIEGNGSGGVTYKTSGSDFAEYLRLLQKDEIIEAGDIVGIFGGKITKKTQGTDQVRVISSAPCVLGNYPGNDKEHLYRKVAFIGQVPVKVCGLVKIGDYIIPSGMNNGTGIAVSPKALSASHYGQIVGVAWESSDETGVTLIKAEVGLHIATKQLGELSREKDQQIEQLTQTTQELQARLEALEKLVEGREKEEKLYSFNR